MRSSISATNLQFFRIRSTHLYQARQGHNLPAALLLALGLVFHSLPQFAGGLAFAGAWLLGIYTPSASRWRFHLATAVAVLSTAILALA